VIPRDLPAGLRVADEAIERLGPARQRGGFDDTLPNWVFFTMFKVIALGWSGRLPEAVALVAKLAEIARDHAKPYDSILHHMAATNLALRRGDATSALASARELVAATGRVENLMVWAIGRTTLGWALTLSGEWDVAAEAFLEVSSAQERGIARNLVVANLSGLAEVRLGQRDFAATRALAEDILGRTKDVPATLGKAQAYLLLARAALRSGSGSTERIEAWLVEAESQAQRTGYVLVHPDILECRAELAAARGEEDRRLAYLREALRLYTSAGADGHAARLTRSLGEASATA
jgi:tetratricopeptide (TPR) repeat protein